MLFDIRRGMPDLPNGTRRHNKEQIQAATVLNDLYWYLALTRSHWLDNTPAPYNFLPKPKWQIPRQGLCLGKLLTIRLA